MFILFLSYGETTGGGVPSDAVTAHQEGYGAKEPEGEEKKDVESPELAATELAEEDGNGVTWGLQARETVSRMRTAKPSAAQASVSAAGTIFEQAIRHAVIISGDAVTVQTTMGDEIWMIEGILKTSSKKALSTQSLLLSNENAQRHCAACNLAANQKRRKRRKH